jgi:ParB family chromosome partitioning protein
VSKKALGRGLDALLSPKPERIDTRTEERTTSGEKALNNEGVIFISIDNVIPNPDQPRKEFKEESLQELADSIREKGIIQPIIAERVAGGTEGTGEATGTGEQGAHYRIVAGERRFRAAKLAQLDEIPVIIKQFSREEKLEIALIENVQRDDLTPIEEAEAYHNLISTTGKNQEEIAKKVGKKRSTIANSLRLLKMSEEMKTAVSEGNLSAGHARAILSVTNPADQELLFKRCISKNLSVREAERQAAQLNSGKRRESSAKDGSSTIREKQSKSTEIRQLEESLIKVLGTKVVIKGNDQKGKLEIEYYSTEDLDRICEQISGKQ